MTDTTVTSIVQQGRKLDRTANSLGWGCDSMDAFDVFVTPISKHKIMDWVVEVGGVLHAFFERVDGVEVRGALHEAVQRFLNARKQEKEKDNARAVVTTDQHTSAVTDQSNGCQRVEGGASLPTRGFPHHESGEVAQTGVKGSNDFVTPKEKTAVVGTAIESNGYEGDLNFSQFVDLNGDAGRQDSPVRSVKIEDDSATVLRMRC